MVLRRKARTPTTPKSATSRTSSRATTPTPTPASATTTTPTPTLISSNQPKSNYPNFKLFIEYCVEVDLNQPFTTQHLDAPASAKHGLVKFVNMDRSLLLMLTDKEMFLDKPLWWPGTTDLCITYGYLNDITISRSDERKLALDIKSFNPGKRLIHVFSSISKEEREKLVTTLTNNAKQYQQMINQQKAMQQQQATLYMSQANAQKSSVSSKTSPGVFNFNEADCEAYGYSPTIYPVTHLNDTPYTQYRNRSLSPGPLHSTTPEAYQHKPSMMSRYPRHEEKGNQVEESLLYTRGLSKSQPQLSYPHENTYPYQDGHFQKSESRNNYRTPGYEPYSSVVPKYGGSSSTAAAGPGHTPSRVVCYNDDDVYDQDVNRPRSIKMNGDDLVLKINCYNPETRARSPGATHIVRISHGDDVENNNRRY
ncbi:unnamed protein product [Heterobilharzia americana]|nr:unnamed protein product [Heterobilharzia americana]